MLTQQDYMAAMSYAAMCNNQYNNTYDMQKYQHPIQYTIHDKIANGLPVMFNPAQQPISNFKYNGDRFQADVNMNTTNVACTVAGVAAGAGLAYWLLKKFCH